MDPQWSRWRHDTKYFEEDLDPTEDEITREYFEEHKALDSRYVGSSSLSLPPYHGAVSLNKREASIASIRCLYAPTPLI